MILRGAAETLMDPNDRLTKTKGTVVPSQIER